MDRQKELFSLFADRYSVRDYSDRPLTRGQLTQLIEVARIASSACNRQPWVFAIADTPQLCAAIASCYDRAWMAGAPAFIVACGDHSQGWHRADGKDHTDIDVAIAVTQITLAATAMGLGTCWVCNFDAERLRSTLDIPQHLEPIAILPVGYPADGSATPEKKRKTADEITVWGKFQ